MNAADLPDNSIVVGPTSNGREVVYIKNHPSKTAQWRGTDGGYHGNWAIDEALRYDEATILRVGVGE